MPTARFQIASGSKSTMRFGLAMAGFVLVIPLAIVLFGLPHGAVVFTASDDGLRISGDPYGRFLAQSELDLSKARKLDLETEPSFTLTRRTNGIGLPGYQSGWFETAGAGKVLVFVADWSRAMVVPTKLGYSLILAPESPDLLIDHLKKPYKPPEPHLLATPDSEGEGMPPGLVALSAWLIGVPLVISTFLIWVTVRTRGVVFELSDESLRISGDLYGRTIPRSSLRLDEARLVNLKADPDRPSLVRTNGVGLPGFSSGWHRAFKERAKYLLFVTERTRVVRIPTTLGYTLLLSPAAPESFMNAIKTM